MKTSTAIALALVLAAQVDAKPSFVSRIPNGANVPGVTAVGHSDGTGKSSSLNKFGFAFANAGNSWKTSLCQADSDGDGQTNGQELGDPCCTWSTGATPTFTSGVSDPGDASSTVASSVLANITCATASPSTSTTSGAAAAQTSAVAALATALAGWILTQ